MRVIGLDVSRTVVEVAYLEHGRVHSSGRVGKSALMRRSSGLPK
jgi:hypothetical protein